MAPTSVLPPHTSALRSKDGSVAPQQHTDVRTHLSCKLPRESNKSVSRLRSTVSSLKSWLPSFYLLTADFPNMISSISFWLPRLRQALRKGHNLVRYDKRTVSSSKENKCFSLKRAKREKCKAFCIEMPQFSNKHHSRWWNTASGQRDWTAKLHQTSPA